MISSPCPRRTIPVIINMTIAAILQTVNTICIREAHFTLAQFTNRITAAMKRSKNLSRLKQRLVFYNLYRFHSRKTEKGTKRQKKTVWVLIFSCREWFLFGNALPAWQAFEREREGNKGARSRTREEGGGEPFLSPSPASPHAQNPPSPSPFNACYVGKAIPKNYILPNTDNQHWLVAEDDRDLTVSQGLEPFSKLLKFLSRILNI